MIPHRSIAQSCQTPWPSRILHWNYRHQHRLLTNSSYVHLSGSQTPGMQETVPLTIRRVSMTSCNSSFGLLCDRVYIGVLKSAVGSGEQTYLFVLEASGESHPGNVQICYLFTPPSSLPSSACEDSQRTLSRNWESVGHVMGSFSRSTNHMHPSHHLLL